MKKFVYALAVCLMACLPTGCSDNDDPDPVPEGEKVTLTEAGTLRTVLGERVLEIEAIDVKGPMDYPDLFTLLYASRDGRLISIDLSEANLEDNTIPAYTFCDFVNGAPASVDARPASIFDEWEMTPKFTRFVFPKNLEKIGSASFCYTRLEELIFPPTLRVIDSSAFAGCKNLKQDILFFPEGLEFIGVSAFRNAALKDVVLPSSLRVVGGAAFSYSISGNVYSLSSEPPACAYDELFAGCENSTLYVPIGTGETYANARGWNGFAKIVETKDFPKNVDAQ